jgi:hypothetical protein
VNLFISTQLLNSNRKKLAGFSQSSISKDPYKSNDQCVLQMPCMFHQPRSPLNHPLKTSMRELVLANIGFDRY